MDLLLLETGGTDNLLLESGDALILDNSASTSNPYNYYAQQQ